MSASPLVGVHISHEQLDPRTALEVARRADALGFRDGLCSDHLTPWSERQGESGFAWAWLGAALATTSMRFGVVTAPGQRYHPVIAAQAIATLEQMHPGRFWAALGSGEAMNEHVTGDAWPAKSERTARLGECVDVLRELLAGREVSHRGRVVVDRARVWSLPETPPPLVGAAVTAETAAWAATWADGLITISQPFEKLRDIIGAYREAGGAGDVSVQSQLAYVRPANGGREAARALAHDQWRTNVFEPPLCWDLPTPEHYDLAADGMSVERVAESVHCVDSTTALAELVDEHGRAGADRVYLHHVGKTQAAFLDDTAAALLH
ncbi:LLM class F420-dependent oxidoreductase [Pseudoclavibacter endophyticus]|uniref:TIGR03885 family FMN-dependent LLM class oxidoreductase n=1 Tax=Pseudoclavibacter endophyticus TaxID=1778590 RepID=A0A6H9WD07_9MICO|nr:TIGR03885 family FMN-dependent LLM class oxidoreductase [Pseudoclavibacter endophyticus]KAB1648842.1 TIGR03885 family FMN-dependent LLM class oxidoreductase [Pseudoclavibacter endophyticus]GGA67893.1 LLM class F420-dependent oxidoreductase [Pseudoclavibacter endophyticus]